MAAWARRRTPTTDQPSRGVARCTWFAPLLVPSDRCKDAENGGRRIEVGDTMAELSWKDKRPGSATGRASRIDDGRRAGVAFE